MLVKIKIRTVKQIISLISCQIMKRFWNERGKKTRKYLRVVVGHVLLIKGRKEY